MKCLLQGTYTRHSQRVERLILMRKWWKWERIPLGYNLETGSFRVSSKEKEFGSRMNVNKWLSIQHLTNIYCALC